MLNGKAAKPKIVEGKLAAAGGSVEPIIAP